MHLASQKRVLVYIKFLTHFFFFFVTDQWPIHRYEKKMELQIQTKNNAICHHLQLLLLEHKNRPYLASQQVYAVVNRYIVASMKERNIAAICSTLFLAVQLCICMLYAEFQISSINVQRCFVFVSCISILNTIQSGAKYKLYSEGGK